QPRRTRSTEPARPVLLLRRLPHRAGRRALFPVRLSQDLPSRLGGPVAGDRTMTSRPAPSSAALTGIGARLPAGPHREDLRGPAAVWEALLRGQPATSRYPEARWKAMVERLHPKDRTDVPWPVAHLDLPEP